MTFQLNIACINRDRLRTWEQKLTENEATPIVCMAVGHGKNIGQLYLIMPHEIKKKEITSLLGRAIDEEENPDGMVIRLDA